MLRISLIQRNKARHIMTWYARIFDTETKEIRYESLGTTKKTEAHDLMLAKQADGEFERKPKSGITMGQAFESYIKNLENNGCSLDTISTAMQSYKSVFCLRDIPITEITKKQLFDVFVEQNKNIKPNTYNTRKTFLKSALKFAISINDLGIANPADVLKSKKCIMGERPFWTQEQIDLILDKAPSQMHRLLWSFMAFAGMRISEAKNAKPTDIRNGFIYVIGKGNKPAKIPISSRMQKEIDMVSSNWDFTHIESLNALKKAAKKALGDDYDGMSFNHRFRHSFASALIKNDCNPKSCQMLLRHSNINTTLQIYTHMSDEYLKNDIEKMFEIVDNDK